MQISSRMWISSSSSKRPSNDGMRALASSGASGHRFPNAANSYLCNFFCIKRLKKKRDESKIRFKNSNEILYMEIMGLGLVVTFSRTQLFPYSWIFENCPCMRKFSWTLRKIPVPRPLTHSVSFGDPRAYEPQRLGVFRHFQILFN